MAAITTAVIAGAGLLLTLEAQRQAKEADQHAANLNARESERNAELTRQQAEEDARQFRLSFRRDQARNVAQIGASGIKLEGSPLEVLQDNNIAAERDFQNIKAGGEQRRESYLRQARIYRETGSANAAAAETQSAATLLGGAANIYSTGSKSGAW